MTAEDCIRSGDLDAALKRLQDEIRANPSKAELRVFLFQLLCVLGRWDRAMTQLNVVADMDPKSLLMASIYRPVLNCEALRAEVFAGARTPLVFGEPDPWLGPLTQALRMLADGKGVAAGELRDQAFEAAPATPGTIDGQAFEWIADADSRLGPVLEAIVNGKYYWIPFACIRRVQLETPVNLRDLVWVSAQFTWVNGGASAGLIPARYTGTESVDDSSLRMAKRTEWDEAGNGFYIGKGQRLLATDQDEYPLLQAREILFDDAVVDAAGGGADDG